MSMKKISLYITEKFKISKKTNLKEYYFPKTKEELIDNIKTVIRNSPKKRTIDLNCIDVSNIIDLSYVFQNINQTYKLFKIDVSSWNVSNVTNMRKIFSDCKSLETDISMWNVNKVENLSFAFFNCKKFNCDLSKWNPKNLKELTAAFAGAENLNCYLSSWDISNLDKKDFKWAFNNCGVKGYPKGYYRY